MGRLIDADDFIEKLAHVPMVQEAIRKAFDQMPTIDAVEVVRCKDCKNRYRTECTMKYLTQMRSNNMDFCSWGER